MGGVVWSDGLQVVSTREPEEVDDLLRSLGRKEFLRRERQSAVAGATQHSFVHSLVRDAVYAQLPRPDRIDRHVRVARWIESLPEDAARTVPSSWHTTTSRRSSSRGARASIGELVPAASAALRESGMRAFAVGAYLAAVRALRAAATLRPDGLDARALRALGKALTFTEHTGLDELRRAFEQLLDEGKGLEAAAAAADLSFGLWQHGDGAGSAAWMVRALELVGEGGRSRHEAHVLAQAARRSMLAGDSQEAIELAGRAMELATSIGVEAVGSPPSSPARRRRRTSPSTACTGGPRRGRGAGACERPVGSRRAYVNLGSVLLETGDVQGAIATARQAIVIGERMGMIGGSGGFAFGNLVEAQFIAGDSDEAAATSIAELERADPRGPLPGASVQTRARRARVRSGRPRGRGGGDREEPGRGGP